MRQLKDLLRLKFAAGLSHRQIADCLGISVGVVAKYVTAATRAVTLGAPSRKTIVSILQRGLDTRPMPADETPENSRPALSHDNVRGADYYR